MGRLQVLHKMSSEDWLNLGKTRVWSFYIYKELSLQRNCGMYRRWKKSNTIFMSL